MSADLHVDSTAVRALAHTHAAHAADLAAVATALAGIPVSAIADALGPVGHRFAAALAEAVADTQMRAAALAGGAMAGADAASGSASAYDDAQQRAAALILR